MQNCFAARRKEMYPSKGNTPYGQQVFGSSQAYGLVSILFLFVFPYMKFTGAFR